MPTQLNPNPNHTFTLFYFIIIISKPTDQLSTTQKSVLTESIYSAAFGAQNPAGKAHYSTTPLPTIDTGPTVFIGGETRVHSPGAGATHLAVGFGTQPCSAALLQVAAMCIGSGSDGGMSGFSSPVGTMGGNGGGILGAYSGAIPAGAAPEAIDRICEVLTAAPPSVEVVERAKALAKATALFEMEDGSKNLAEGMTRCVLEYDVFEGGSLSASIAAEYDAITV